MSVDDLVVRGGTEHVPAVRRWVSDRLIGRCTDDIVHAAELVTSELVTNAVLHAGPEVRLHVDVRDAEHVTLEVYDRSRSLPVRPAPRRDGQTGMTGRGLSLIDALAERWSVAATDEGKRITVELTGASVAAQNADVGDIDDLLRSLPDLESSHATAGPKRHTVTLGDVPTALLLEAKVHVDSLLREFILTTRGAASGVTARVPAHLATLVEAVSSEFSEARQSIKRQAAAAATRGDRRTTLVLTLPAEAADAGERYLAALEAADAYARDARLLTLEAPPQHRVFRRWYVGSLVRALRAAAAGGPVPETVEFEAFVLAEFDALAGLQRATERSARLQRVSAAFSRAVTVAEATRTLLDEAVRGMHATRAAVILRREDAPSMLDVGYDAGLRKRLKAALDSGEVVPVGDAFAGRPLWVESREERDATFPLLATLEPDITAFAALPLCAGGRVIGVLRLNFTETRLFDDAERDYLESLTSMGAQTIERCLLQGRQARLTERLRILQRVTTALARARGTEDVGDVVVEQATAVINAEVGALCLLDDDRHTVRLVRMRSPDPDAAVGWRAFDVDDDVPAAEVIRTRRMVSVASIAERDARWPELVGVGLREEHVLVVLPLVANNTVLGALSLSSTTTRNIDEADLELLGSLAESCAQALARTQSMERLARASSQLAFLAHASAELGSGHDVLASLRHVAGLAVPDLADWCVIHVLRDGGLVPLVVLHADPARVALAEQVQVRWPEPLDGPGVGQVVRDGISLHYSVVTDDMLGADLDRDPEHLEMLLMLGISSVIIAPLRARDRTLGALTLILSGDRHYDRADVAFAEDLAARAALALLEP